MEQINKKNHKALALWAANCAEQVLPYFEKRYPKDHRPRKAIEAARKWVKGKITVGEARRAALSAHAAARDASQPAAIAAARSAGHAAATAHVADHFYATAGYAIKSAKAFGKI
jgi:hypothetical protein